MLETGTECGRTSVTNGYHRTRYRSRQAQIGGILVQVACRLVQMRCGYLSSRFRARANHLGIAVTCNAPWCTVPSALLHSRIHNAAQCLSRCCMVGSTLLHGRIKDAARCVLVAVRSDRPCCQVVSQLVQVASLVLPSRFMVRASHFWHHVKSVMASFQVDSEFVQMTSSLQ